MGTSPSRAACWASSQGNLHEVVVHGVGTEVRSQEVREIWVLTSDLSLDRELQRRGDHIGLHVALAQADHAEVATGPAPQRFWRGFRSFLRGWRPRPTKRVPSIAITSMELGDRTAIVNGAAGPQFTLGRQRRL